MVVDRYDNSPAMQVAHKKYVVNMQDGQALKAIIEKEKPTEQPEGNEDPYWWIKQDQIQRQKEIQGAR